MVKIVEIQKAVCAYFRQNVDGYGSFTVHDLLGPSRTRKICTPRHLAMYLARTMAKKSYPIIGREFGCLDHTSIMHGVWRAEEELKKQNTIFCAAVEYLTCERIGCVTSTEKAIQSTNSLSHMGRFSGMQ